MPSTRRTSPASPRAGQPLPPFALPDTSGGITRLLDFRQRRPVLVTFLHDAACPDCRAWLAALARLRARLDELNVVPLVILPSDLPALRALALDLPFALLSDADGSLAAHYGLTDGKRGRVGVFAANRYGYLLEAWAADEASVLPPPDAALDVIAFAEQEDCGCGLPAWPPELMEDE